MTDLVFLARVVVHSTDLGLYTSFGIYLGLMQLLVWTIARHSADIEWWRMTTFCILVGVLTSMGLAFGGARGLLTAAVLGFLGGWMLLGYVFELETWQRAVITAVGPPAVVVSALAGYWLKDVILEGLKVLM